MTNMTYKIPPKYANCWFSYIFTIFGNYYIGKHPLCTIHASTCTNTYAHKQLSGNYTIHINRAKKNMKISNSVCSPTDCWYRISQKLSRFNHPFDFQLFFSLLFGIQIASRDCTMIFFSLSMNIVMFFFTVTYPFMCRARNLYLLLLLNIKSLVLKMNRIWSEMKKKSLDLHEIFQFIPYKMLLILLQYLHFYTLLIQL